MNNNKKNSSKQPLSILTSTFKNKNYLFLSTHLLFCVSLRNCSLNIFWANYTFIWETILAIWGFCDTQCKNDIHTKKRIVLLFIQKCFNLNENENCIGAYTKVLLFIYFVVLFLVFYFLFCITGNMLNFTTQQ